MQVGIVTSFGCRRNNPFSVDKLGGHASWVNRRGCSTSFGHNRRGGGRNGKMWGPATAPHSLRQPESICFCLVEVGACAEKVASATTGKTRLGAYMQIRGKPCTGRPHRSH